MSMRRWLAAAAASLAVVGTVATMSPAQAATTGGDTAFTYSGTWNNPGVEHWSGTVGSTATGTVDVASGGGTITVGGVSHQGDGYALVTVDAATPVLVDTGSSAACCPQRDWFTTPVLAAGRHVVKIVVSGQKSATETGTAISVMKIATSNGNIVTPTAPAPSQSSVSLTLQPGNNQMTMTGTLTPGTDGANGIIYSRTPSDWASTPYVGNTSTMTMLYLTNGTSYTFKAQPVKDGVAVGTPTTVVGTPSANATTPTPTPSPAPTPAPAGDAGAAAVQNLSLPAQPGWFSGVSGPGSLDGAFGTWRGQPTTELSTWHDAPDGGSWGWGPGQAEVGFKGLLNVAPGGPTDWTAASNGSLDTQLRDYLTRLKTARTIGGVLYPTILRFGHEMNGSWYAWSVTDGEEAAFRATMTRWEGIADTAFPEAMMELCVNGETVNAGVDISELWVDGVFDIYSVDRYNAWPYIGTATGGGESGTVTFADGSMRGTSGDPIGIERHRLFAEAHGVPLGVPEYANAGDHGDDTAWQAAWWPWVDSHAGKTAGKLLYESWFNISRGNYGDAYWLWDTAGTNGLEPKNVTAYANAFPMS